MLLPSDILNIIFDYYSQLRDMNWTPFIDDKTGKLTWKVNKYSAKYDNIHKLLEYRKNNPRCDILLYVYDNDIDIIMGTVVYLNTFHVISVVKKGFEIDNPIMLQDVISSTKYNNYIEYTFRRLVSYIYIEYCIKDSKYFLFCSLLNNSGILCFSKINNYAVYQETNIYNKVTILERLNYNEYLLNIKNF